MAGKATDTTPGNGEEVRSAFPEFPTSRPPCRTCVETLRQGLSRLETACLPCPHPPSACSYQAYSRPGTAGRTRYAFTPCRRLKPQPRKIRAGNIPSSHKQLDRPRIKGHGACLGIGFLSARLGGIGFGKNSKDLHPKGKHDRMQMSIAMFVAL